MDYQEKELNNKLDIKKISKKRRSLLVFFVILFLFLGFAGFASYKTSFSFSKALKASFPFWEKVSGFLPIDNSPTKDPNRLNILVLGIRGADDPNGGLLADTIMVVSFDKSKKKVALISIPRDLYVNVPKDLSEKYDQAKINFIYALGKEKDWQGGGLNYTREVVSEITGLYLDYALSINFTAFEKIISILGGITVYLDKPFIEETQWQNDPEFALSEGKFYLPAGSNELDGKRALYYVRSRFSSNDFDRARRQQEVIKAIANKTLSLGVLANPLKVIDIFKVLSDNVETDIKISTLKGLIPLVQELTSIEPIRLVFDTSEDGYLYAAHYNGSFILLPKGGTFEQIREACKNIFNLN